MLKRLNKEKENSEKVTPEENCKHKFVRYPPKVGRFKVCTKCSFLWILGDVKFGEHSIKLSGSGNYIEASTTAAPANPVAGKVRVYATSGTSLRMRDSTGTETDLAATGGGNFYNYLTNPGFEIWQRGVGAFTANLAYTADRWVNGIGGSTQSITREATIIDSFSKYALKCVCVYGTESFVYQLITDPAGTRPIVGLVGKVLTFSIRVRSDTASAVRATIEDGVTRTYSSYHTGGGTFETLTATQTIAATATDVRVGVAYAASNTSYLDNAALCIVSNSLDNYVPLDAAEEWERCQRYYEVQGYDNAVGDLIIRDSNTLLNNVFSGYLAFLSRKAVLPTTTKNGTWNATNCGQPSVPNRTKTGYEIQASGTVNNAQGQFYTQDATTYITAEANP